MKDLTLYLIQNLTAHPEAVLVEEKEENGIVNIIVKVADEDKGRVIGKEGRIIKAIRALVGAAAAKQGKRSHVQIS